MKCVNWFGFGSVLVIVVLYGHDVMAEDGDEWLADGFNDGNQVDEEEVDMDYFVDKLSSYGQWYETEKYGWVWQPDGLAEDWRPFTYGRWKYTDYGWTWESSFPWGWAAFHYGAWAHMPELGWVWVPAEVWSPARVVWRYHTDYVGWAPIVVDYDYYVAWDVYPVYYTHWSFIGWAFFSMPTCGTTSSTTIKTTGISNTPTIPADVVTTPARHVITDPLPTKWLRLRVNP